MKQVSFSAKEDTQTLRLWEKYGKLDFQDYTFPTYHQRSSLETLKRVI